MVYNEKGSFFITVVCQKTTEYERVLMAGITIEKGKKIYNYGQPLTALHLITKGNVQVLYPGGSYQLGKGDVLGICEICSEIHFLSYVTTEEVTILTYPVSNMEALDELLKKHSDVARLFVMSLFRQINTLLERNSISETSCVNLYQHLMSDCEKYNMFCTRYRIQSRPSEEISSVNAYLGEESADSWLNSYYLALQHVYARESAKLLILEPGLSMGMLRKGSLDFRKNYTVLEEQNNYRQQVASFYFNESGNDLFNLYTSLYYRLGQNCEDAGEIAVIIKRIIDDFKTEPAVDKNLFAARVQSFQNNVSMLNTAKKDDADAEDVSSAVLTELTGSLNAILEFSGLDSEKSAAFRQNVVIYKTMSDKNSMDDDCCRLRRRLTDQFYELYSAVFERSLTSPELPIPIKMFLYFGYVDEELAGSANCGTLYKLTVGMEDHSKFGLYTFYSWLLAIFRGEKNPSRNEFDEDYFDFINKQKANKSLTPAEAAAFADTPMNRVSYELRNMFPQTNKITFGRVTTFCPLFTSDNVLKDLGSSFVTLTQVNKALEMIKKIDYSAFYRESLDYENINVMGKETIHLEYLPDIILMPNVGIRGVMWQEIEGKRRNSPSRMLFSIFHMEDLNTSLVRLTGEFRWELCKRVQGPRWNDVSEPSLTSEYFDYIQFYRKNHELTGEAKEKIKNSLQRAKNSFKEMFIRDYIVWVLFEGTGSPRLNKVARKILFSYCPFPSSMNGMLEQNPLYGELMSRRKVISGQRAHHLDVLMQKLRNSNAKIPETLEAEKNFVLGKI